MCYHLLVMSIINFDELSPIRKKHKEQKIVFCSGSFDLTHAGHVLFFEECTKHADILVVMIGNDFNLRHYKGEDRPVLNEYLRLKMVSSLKPVDYAFLDLDAQDKDLLAIFPRILSELQPDFYAINQDAFDIPRRQEFVKGTEVKMLIFERTCPPKFENISASKIIEKIKKG